MLFFTFGQFTRVFGIGTQIRGTTMRILTSWGFRKCRTFWVWESPKGSYWASKSTDFENLGPLPKIRGVAKKRHGHNFEFSGTKRISALVNPMSYVGYSFQARKIKIVAVLFFLTPPPTHFFWKFDSTLTVNNSPLKTPTPKNYHILGKPRTWTFTCNMVLSWMWYSTWKFWVIHVLVS